MHVVAVGADGIARCRDDEGAESDVMTDLLGEVAPGATLLVHAGVALTHLGDAE
jgi:hydrogenase maturation factor